MSIQISGISRASILSALFGLTGGCASIIDGTTQVVTIETYIEGSQASASCKLANSKGVWHVTAPGTASVQRAYGDMAVDCTAPGARQASLPVASSTKALVFGNILIGGMLGAVVDVANGAAYDYPSLIKVSFADVAHGVEPKPAVLQRAADADLSPVLADSGCSPIKPPSPFRSSAGGQYLEAFCADGRLIHLACDGATCRLRTSADR